MSRIASLIVFKDDKEKERYKAFFNAKHKGMMPFYAMFKFYVKPAMEKWEKENK